MSKKNALLFSCMEAVLPIFLFLLLPACLPLESSSAFVDSHQPIPGTSVLPLFPSCSPSTILRVWHDRLWYGTNLPPRYCAAWTGPGREVRTGNNEARFSGLWPWSR
ncbi:hypothetical protein L207DRAFT_526588 [Hyaloscypha variabilis F]|uniref:Secreted protein n=1 Tax=Hyaloscypha variabilis (strain UAMH 11265 / GT02V1 / F) TaxID=1149755 RepID=A0A2J6RY30_HYAVF|nr:hypothetical protein L207DRAFT_526588 [Hyaloscypha variabilis F]